MPAATALRLDDIGWHAGQLDIRWSVDDYRFATTTWFTGLSFDDLAALHGQPAVERLAFHVALFELNKGVSFGPSRLELPRRWQPYLSTELFELWRRVVRGVWAQWRYEHDRPDYFGPEPAAPPVVDERGPLAPLPGAAAGRAGASAGVTDLWFCGGGKDSLLAAHVLDTLGVPYDGLAYSYSNYGRAEPQHALIDRVFDATTVGRRHRAFSYDTSLDLPGRWVRPFAGAGYVLAAETPSSIFSALPICLAHGYRRLLLAHERSANTGNLVWDATGEKVNHQWGKSAEAEALISDYVRAHVLPGVHYTSLLQPVFDALIFYSLRDVAQSIPRAHSCNVEKPWCKRCPKCAYVWVCYKAWLPLAQVDRVFGSSNLLDVPENQLWYRQMLGLEAHTPFECIGQVAETRLAFRLARARGVTGAAMAYLDEVGEVDWLATAEHYLSVSDDHHLDDDLGPAVAAYFRSKSAEAMDYVSALIG